MLDLNLNCPTFFICMFLIRASSAHFISCSLNEISMMSPMNYVKSQDDQGPFKLY